jgi:carboxymethylenebutenolidase
MTETSITIRTADGDCPAYVYTPGGQGPWPAVIVYMSIFGMRPAIRSMCEHIAGGGYVVLLPDIFYRRGEYSPLDPAAIFASGDMSALKPMRECTDNLRAAADTECFLTYLDTRDDVAGEKIGTVGFCFGGGMAIAAAGLYSERVAATVSFHGGNLATDQPTSPHLVAPKIRGELYLAVADQDKSYPPEMAERFEKVLDDAGVRYRSELYAGCSHGWMKPDVPVYDAKAAERGWGEMFALFERALKS